MVSWIKLQNLKCRMKTLKNWLRDLKTKYVKYLGNGEKRSMAAFNAVKPLLCEKLNKYLNSKKRSKAGVIEPLAPRKMDLMVFFTALFECVDSGSKEDYIELHYPQIKGSFNRYKTHCTQSRVIPELIDELRDCKGDCIPNQFIIDSFMAKSWDGSEDTGKNPTDRGRQGIKGNIVCGPDKFVYAHQILPANKSENECLRRLLTSGAMHFGKSVSLLADRGYSGKGIAQECKDKQIRLICQPKAVQPKRLKEFTCLSCKQGKGCKNGVTCVNSNARRHPNDPPKMSHKLHYRDAKALRENRSYVEHVNGYLRRFRGINTKFVKKSSNYRMYVDVGIMCLNLNILFENGQL